jgi:ketosteroid isomerase-like protein
MIPGDPPSHPAHSDRTRVLAVNQAFYDAFEGCSLPAMEQVWDHSDDVVCVHPGWPILVGWPAVRQSWERLLANGQNLQFILTDAVATMGTDMAFVRASENLLADGEVRGSVAVINVFARRSDGAWRMVAHHGSPVVA